MEPIQKLAERLRNGGFSAALVSDPNAIRYFTGIRFSPGERLLALVVTGSGQATLVINKLFLYDGDISAAWYSDAQDGVARWPVCWKEKWLWIRASPPGSCSACSSCARSCSWPWALSLTR